MSNHSFIENQVTLYDNEIWHGYRRTQDNNCIKLLISIIFMILSNIKPNCCAFLKFFISSYFYSAKTSLRTIENITFQSFSFHDHFHKMLRLFDCFTKFSCNQKWNDARLLLISMVYTSCLTNYHLGDLRKLGNIRRVFKLHRIKA